MQLPKPKKLDRAEALRYLGMQGILPDDGTEALLNSCEAELLYSMEPRAIWRETALTMLTESQNGTDLQRHLRNCGAALLMAVTLGPGVDRLLRRYAATDIAAAAVADALASAAVEQVCDALETELRGQYEPQNRYLTGRYSPGYGDCPLRLQKELCSVLDTARKIGLSASENFLLVPRKSVTAILGISDRPVTGYRAGCGHCVLRETCEYRKKGGTCES